MVELQNTPWNVGDVDTRDIYGSFLLLYMYAALDTDTHTRVVQTTTLQAFLIKDKLLCRHRNRK